MPGEDIRFLQSKRRGSGEKNHTKLKQAAADTGVYPETVRQLEHKALRALRRRRELRQFVEQRTPYYLRVGAAEFQRTGDSAVERIVFKREKLMERGENI